jgi:hypothetical protein
MPSTTTAHPRASIAIAYSAAALLAVASGATNVLSAIGKHADIGPQLIAASIALAVAGLVTITLPVAIQLVRSRNYAGALIASIAFVLAASFSVTAALGTLGAPRLQAAMTVSHFDSSRSRLDQERNRAVVELGNLASARPASDLNGIIATKLSTPCANGCHKIDGQVSTRICAEVAALQEEASRANRISALTGTIARIDKEAAQLGSPKIANGDAAALVAVLAVFGIAVDVGAVNVALIVLAVVILECGSGLSLAIAQSMRVGAPVALLQAVPALPAPMTPAIEEPAAAASDVTRATADKIMAAAKQSGGKLTATSKREVARMIEATPPTAARALAFIAAARMATVTVGADHVQVVL